MATRSFSNLREYLTTPFRASFQIGDHPSLPITLRTESWDYDPVLGTHGKDFRTLEHLFNHYNKYNAGSRLDRAVYLRQHRSNECLLEYIVFQEGPYKTLSVAKTLELTPAEWADMPELLSLEAEGAKAAAATVRVESSPEAANTILYATEQTAPVAIAKRTCAEKVADLERRCDAIHRGIDEMKQRRGTLEAEVTRMEAAASRINAASLSLSDLVTRLQAISEAKLRGGSVYR